MLEHEDSEKDENQEEQNVDNFFGKRILLMFFSLA